MRQRLTDLTTIDSTEIARLIDAGDEVVIQFSKAVYTPELLATVDRLCQQHGDRIEVRFFSHHGRSFDGSVLASIPSVAHLSVDCLTEATGLEAIHALTRLRALSLGVYRLSDRRILAAGNLSRLRRLSLPEIAKGSIDLAPVADMQDLEFLSVSGHHANLESIGPLRRLQSVRLCRMGKEIDLRIINRITGLRSLSILLGGREHLDGIEHAGLRHLEIIRVRGLSRFAPAAFPALESLQVEDQIRLKALDVSRASRALKVLRIFTCKGLERLEGIPACTALEDLRIARTSLDLTRLIDGGLPRSLKACLMASGRKAVDRDLERRLLGMGLPRMGR